MTMTERAAEYLLEYDELMTLGKTKLAETIEIDGKKLSHTTWSKAKRLAKERKR